MAAHIETGTMASPEQYKSYNLDHLGLVAGMYDLTFRGSVFSMNMVNCKVKIAKFCFQVVNTYF